MIVDAQVHLWKANTPDRPWLPNRVAQLPEPFLIEQLVPMMDEAGVDRAVIVPPSWEGDRNDYGLEAAQRYPSRFAVMGRIPLTEPNNAALFADWTKQPGMRGIRVTFHPPQWTWLTDGTADWFWPAAERLNIDVLANEDADAAHNTLTSLPGIGPWTADVYLLFCLGHGDAWPAGDLAVQEALRMGLGLKRRPSAREMAPLAEPWRPLRGAAAHLWWSYYRAIKKREGVIAGAQKANDVSNNVAVAKQPPVKAKITARKVPGS